MTELRPSLREVFASLKGRCMVDEAAIDHMEHRLNKSGNALESPWYVNVAMTFGPWAAALSFITFLARYWHILPDIALGVALLAVATILSYLGKRLFLSQLALALSLSGQLLVYLSRFHAFHPWWANPLAAIVIVTLLYPLYRHKVHRFLTCMLAMLIITASLLLTRQHSDLLHILILAETIGIGLTLACLRHSVLRPLGYACAVSLPLTLLAPNALLSTTAQFTWLPTRIIMIAALLGLLVVLAKNMEDLLTEPLIIAALAIMILGAVLPPGVLAAVGILVLGYARRERSLIGLGLIFLPVFIGQYYYDLGVDLLTKSWILALSGGALLIIRRVLSGRPWAREESS